MTGQQANGRTGQQANRREFLKTLPVIAAAWRGVVRLRPGRPRLVARLHQDARHPDVRQRHPHQSVQQLFTPKVRLEFQTAAYVVPTDEEHRGVVRGQIESISLQPVGLNDQQLASRSRVTVMVKVKFEDVKEGKTLWENPALSFSDEYELANPSLGQDVSAFVGNDRVAMDRLSTDFARTVVSAILEAF